MVLSLFRSLLAGKPAPRPVYTPPSPPPAAPLAAAAPIHGEALAATAAGPATPPPPAAEAPAPEPLFPAKPPVDIRTLLTEFETLGSDPEFALLRKTLGAGPDGLFGFGTMYPQALAVLLKTRFDGIGEIANLGTRKAWGHYYITETRYDFSWRSDIRADQMEAGAVLAQESARLIRLRDALVTDLAGNRRLFVYAGPATTEQIDAVRSAMGAYGENSLLHVSVATDTNAARHVAWREPGLIRGHISRFGNQGGTWNIAVDDWIAICRAAHGLWQASLR